MKLINKIWLFLIPFLVTSCLGDVTIEVEKIPSNTPNEPIFISGNFNYWDPADPRFMLKLKPDSSGYYVTIPKGFGSLEYKFTRGDWKSVETNRCGENINNRKALVFENENLKDTIESWMDVNHIDCEYFTIVLEDIPENTPKQDEIALLADFNQWGEADQVPVFNTDKKGRKVLKLLKPQNAEKIEFKISRGTINQAESDEFGNELPPRSIDLTTTDSVKLSIENWIDLANKSNKHLLLVIDKLPKTTPQDEKFFLAADQNNWYPRDRNFEFQKLPNGKYALKLPNQPNYMEFKVTRGSWDNVEVDAFGNGIHNRIYKKNKEEDTLHLKIEAWKDQKVFTPGKVTFLVKTSGLPDGEDIYLATDYNGWDEKDRDCKLNRVRTNLYSIELEKRFNPFYFKFTRGDWDKVETDIKGREIENRSYSYNGEDTVRFTIPSWRDLVFEQSPYLTIILEVPPNTPKKDDIYLASEYSGNWWSANDKDFKFSKNSNGFYELRIPKKWNTIEFKITRGRWSSVEVNKDGEDIENRFYQFGKEETLKLKVENWKDLVN